MKVKFSKQDREALSKSLASFENDKLKEVLNVSGAQAGISTWERSVWQKTSELSLA